MLLGTAVIGSDKVAPQIAVAIEGFKGVEVVSFHDAEDTAEQSGA
jgi:hypothetical protein